MKTTIGPLHGVRRPHPSGAGRFDAPPHSPVATSVSCSTRFSLKSVAIERINSADISFQSTGPRQRSVSAAYSSGAARVCIGPAVICASVASPLKPRFSLHFPPPSPGPRPTPFPTGSRPPRSSRYPCCPRPPRPSSCSTTRPIPSTPRARRSFTSAKSSRFSARRAADRALSHRLVRQGLKDPLPACLEHRSRRPRVRRQGQRDARGQPSGRRRKQLYEDIKYRVADPPGRDPGGIVAFEYEERERPYLAETDW